MSEVYFVFTGDYYDCCNCGVDCIIMLHTVDVYYFTASQVGTPLRCNICMYCACVKPSSQYDTDLGS